MDLQQTLISLQSGPVEVRLARVLEELDRERQAVGEIQRSLLRFRHSTLKASGKHALSNNNCYQCHTIVKAKGYIFREYLRI